MKPDTSFKSITKTFIEVPFSFYAEHCYPEAPDAVKFLREEHPHDFTCKVSIEVGHNERELEFYLVRAYLNNLIPILCGIAIKDKTPSCETFASHILTSVLYKYGTHRDITVEVKEDDKYGARKEYKVIG